MVCFKSRVPTIIRTNRRGWTLVFRHNSTQVPTSRHYLKQPIIAIEQATMLQWHNEDTEWKGPANKVANNLLRALLSPLSNERILYSSAQNKMWQSRKRIWDALGAFVADGIQNRTISIINKEQLKAREKSTLPSKCLCSGSRLKKNIFL